MKTKIMLCSVFLLLSAFAGIALGGTEGTSNTFYGFEAGYTIIGGGAGVNNTFIGRGAGYANTTDSNTFIGAYAGYDNTTGNFNVFLGDTAGASNTTGEVNVFFGDSAGYSNTTGFRNLFLGGYAGNSNTTGFYNTFLGYQAGFINSTGSRNVFIGSEAGYLETGSNKLYIDNSYTSNPLIYGEFNNEILTINGNLNVVAPNNGLINLSNVTTNNTTKVGRMVLKHYTNSEEPVYLFGAASTGTNNFVAFGGGNPIGNAATQIDLFTAPNTATPTGYSRLTIIGNGYVGIGIQDPLYPLEMASGAHVTAGGTWTDASSREYKENIEVLGQKEAVEALRGLNPVKFIFKRSPEEQHVGFIAEDVPELVAMTDRKGLSPMEIAAVLAKVIKEQQRVMQEQRNAISALSGELNELKREVGFKGPVALAESSSEK